MGLYRIEEILACPEKGLTELQRRWLRPRNFLTRIAFWGLYVVNWTLVRLLFRFSVVGLQHLPDSRPFIIAPSHASPLDPTFLGAALPYRVLNQTCWAGKQGTIMKTLIRRMASYVVRVIPITNSIRALAPAVVILESRRNLIWFPEGRRSRDGKLHRFRPGIIHVMSWSDVPVVPVFIWGASAAFPANSRFPRLGSRIEVRIGPSQTKEQLGLGTANGYDDAEVAANLRDRVAQLGDTLSSAEQGQHTLQN